MNEQVNQNYFRYENGKIIVGGVVNVDAFDDKEVVLRLTSSAVTIKGSNFKLEEMAVKSGVFTMEGTIGSLSYHDKGQTGFLKKLLK